MIRTVSERVAKPKINGWIRRRKTYSSWSHKFWKQFQLYCDNSSVSCCRYLTEPGRHWIERTIWIIMYIVMLCALTFVINDAWVEFRTSPIVTLQDEDSYPVTNVPFPGIAVCTLNRISYKSARKLADSIYAANISSESYNNILDSLKFLGHLYDYSYSGQKAFKSQHHLLHELLTVFYNGTYDTTSIMKNLTPKCSDVILYCKYASEKVECMDIFTFRKTQEGYCCTFNYIREPDEIVQNNGVDSNEEKYPSEMLFSHGPGVGNGLTLLIEPLPHDYFYTKASSRGWKLIVHKSEDFPDDFAGGAVGQIIAPSTETYLKLDAITFSTPDYLMAYTVEETQCIFYSLEDVPSEDLSKKYTYVDCLVECRMDDIWKTCQCVPFFYPITDHRRVCDVADIPCLSQNKPRWWVLFLDDDPAFDPNLFETEEGVSHDTAVSVDCSRCWPDCNDIRYFVRNSVTNLSPGVLSLNDSSIAKDQSIVHVYFGGHGVTRLRQDVLYYWYELLSNIGGICGIFVGCSIISVLELVYFVVSPMWTGFGELERNTPITKISPRGGDRFDAEMYWDELLPKGQNISARELSVRRDRSKTLGENPEIGMK